MADETLITNDNQTALEGTGQAATSQETTEGQAQATESQQTSGTTEGKPEFADANMQAKFTQRMTELAEKEKSWTSEREQLQKEREDLLKVKAIYDRLDSDPEVVKFVHQRYGVKQQSEITEEELLLAKEDPAKMRDLIRREAQNLVKPLESNVSKVQEELYTTKLTNAINEYAEANPDFWELDGKKGEGLITPLIDYFKRQNPKADPMEIVSAAYKRAKGIYGSIDAKNAEKYKLKTTQEITEKKNASMDNGTNTNASMRNTKPMRMEDVFNQEFDRLIK